MMRNFTLSILALFSLFQVQAQYAAQFQRPVQVFENFGDTIYDYAARLVFDTQTEVINGNMQADGDDIRFVADNCFSAVYDYYIESGMNTSNTVIWVRVPLIYANDTASFLMTYGDPNASAYSDFNATFPNAIITSGDTTVGGNVYAGWVEVNAGDVLSIDAGEICNIYAGYFSIEGSIDGDEAGYGAPSSGPTTGGGPGGGAAGSSSGAGGGSYGGDGGNGGYDSGDPINAGGTAYGGTTSFEIMMGSSGGSASSVSGGDGGAGIALKGTIVSVTGSISANGGENQPGAGQGGGGGAGGGIFLAGDTLIFTGSSQANGGDGSVGTSTANDDGGGGGGGRIKLFSDAFSNITGTTSVIPGLGGPNGGFPAEDGDTGTVHIGTFTFNHPTIGAAAGTFNYSSYDTISATACAFYTVPSGTATYYESGWVTDTFTNSIGCDSVVSIDLTILETTYDTISAGNCYSYTSPSGNHTWTSNGLYSDTLVNANGCDSVVAINLTIYQTSDEYVQETVCIEYASPSGNYVWTETGMYMDTIANQYGCDSIITFNLTIKEVNTDVNQVSDKIVSAVQMGADYQWLDCDDDYAPVSGANGQIYSAQQSGNYAVQVTLDGCTDTSDCVSLIVVGIEDFSFNEEIDYYPNPTNGDLNIQFSKALNNVEIEIYDITGKRIERKAFANSSAISLSLAEFKAGYYFVHVLKDDGQRALLEVLKQ